jgi:uncharacterized protein YdaU (DUF1376 family)
MGTDLPEFSPDRSAPKEIDLYYYNFNIGDYRRDTVHLSILEHGIYRQLIDTYYLNEGPLEADLDALMRTHCVRNADEMQAFKNVLKDFFHEVDGRYVHKGCERVLAQYHAKSDKAKASARARWDRPDANALPTQSKRNANGMLTNNHKPINNNRSPAKPEDVNEEVWKDWLSLRRVKKAPVTATALTRLRAEATKAGLSLQEALTQCVANGWQGFEAEWIKKRATAVVERRGI